MSDHKYVPQRTKYTINMAINKILMKGINVPNNVAPMPRL